MYFRIPYVWCKLHKADRVKFTTMLEVLNMQEMQQILGGASDFCDSMQEIANEATDWSDADWDKWAESYETHCMG